MRILTPAHVQCIEEILGRSLASEELTEFGTLSDLSPAALEVARKIAAETRTLAVKYLLELVPDTRLGVATTFLEDVVEGGISNTEWLARNNR